MQVAYFMDLCILPIIGTFSHCSLLSLLQACSRLPNMASAHVAELDGWDCAVQYSQLWLVGNMLGIISTISLVYQKTTFAVQLKSVCPSPSSSHSPLVSTRIMDRQFEKLNEFEERVYEVYENVIVMERPHVSCSTHTLRKCWKHFLKRDEERRQLQALSALIERSGRSG